MDVITIICTIAVIVGTIYWYFSRIPKVEDPPLVIKPPSLSSSNKTKKERNLNGIPVKILYYSQTGTAEDFAQRLCEDICTYGFAPEVSDVENYFQDDLVNEKFVIFIAATYGEGDPPDNATEFHRWLLDPSREEGCLSNMKYTVFGLGNKTYDNFNQVGKEIDKRLEELGGHRIFSLGLGDDDVNIEKDFLSWKKEFSIDLCKEFDLDPPTNRSTPAARRQRMETYNREDEKIKGINVDVISRWRSIDEKSSKPSPDQKNPYLAQILITKELHSSKSERSCLHVEISTHGDILSYLPGDHLGVYPENDPTMVHKLASQLKADLNLILSIHASDDTSIVGPCTLKAALSQYYDITSVARKPQLRVLAQYAEDEEEKKKLMDLASEDPDVHDLYENFVVHDCRCISDILKEFKSVKVPLDHFLEVLPKMQPRYYSISSSPNKNLGSVHLTAIVVKYQTPTKREALGVATNWFSTHRPDYEKEVYPRIPAFIRRSNFKLPKSSNIPIIMVGPGTGLAPFRGFIQEREYRKSKGDELGLAMLFFGCRHPDKDYLYQEELEEHLKNRNISDLIVAFSRIQENKVYVQHKMAEEERADQIWKLLESGAHFYVCGDAAGMARDVSDTLQLIVMKKGDKSREEAQKYIEDLQKVNRHLSDVWS